MWVYRLGFISETPQKLVGVFVTRFCLVSEAVNGFGFGKCLIVYRLMRVGALFDLCASLF